MTAAFVDALGEKAAERWTSTLFGPATLFWAVGLAMWVVDEGSWNESGDRALDWFAGLTGAEQILVAIGALLGVTALDVLVRRFAFPMLQLLEGYGPLMRISRLTQRQAQRIANAKAELDAFIAGPDLSTLSPKELDRYSTVAELVRRSPTSPAFVTPTRLGNILRAAETWPRDKYGLDGVICWARLWLVIDEEARSEVSKARQALDEAVVLFIWGALVLLVWGWVFFSVPVFLITLVIALVICNFAYWWAKQQATIYADLIEAVYDVRRGKLYDALRLRKPKKSAEEPALGEIVTGYLWWRAGPDLEFVDVAEDDGEDKSGDG